MAQAIVVTETPVSKPKIGVRDVGLLYFALSKGEYEKWKEQLIKLFGENIDINEHVFRKCKEDFKERLSRDNKTLQDKLRAFTDKEAIANQAKHLEEALIKREDAGNASEAMSTQEDTTYFDSSHVAPGTIVQAGKLNTQLIEEPRKTKVEELIKQISHIEKERQAKEADISRAKNAAARCLEQLESVNQMLVS